MNEAVSLIDHVQSKDDRWLFIAVLLVLLVFGLFVIRYLTKKDESKYAQLINIYGEVRDGRDKMVQTNTECVTVMRECNTAFLRVGEALESVQTLLTRLEDDITSTKRRHQ